MWEYCSKRDVADYTGLSESVFSDSWSELVEGLIDEHTGRHFGETAQYTESYDGNGSDLLVLNHTPVVSVSSVSIDGTGVESSGYAVYSAGYIRLVSGESGYPVSHAIGDTRAVFPAGQQNISITYTALSASVPPFVKLAAMLMIAEMAMVAERAGADSSLAVSRATQRAGESDRALRRSTDVSGRLRTILRNTIGEKWRFS